MIKLTPTVEEIDALRATAPEGPVIIVNLLKLKPGADAKAAYMAYSQATAPARDPNMEIVYAGAALKDVGGGEDWDYVIMARYLAFEDFARVVTHPAYQGEAASHRPAALERTIMLITWPMTSADFFGT